MDVTKDSLITALRRVGVLGAVNAGYFDHLFQDSETPQPMSTGFGWFNYANSKPTQVIPGGVWTTIENDSLGTVTNTNYPPFGITRMLDVPTGRILFDELKVGDEIYIRHIVNVIPFTNNTTYAFSHYVGSGVQLRRLPIGEQTLLNAGGGVPTGLVVIDTHLYISDENSRMGGMLPQVFVSNEATIEYAGCYISVTKR